MKAIFIRHGESEANRINAEVKGFLCGRFDCELTERGRAQAEALRDNPVLKGADAVFCSPLIRTIQTARAFTDQELILDERILERTMGEFDGRFIDDVKADPENRKYFEDPEFMSFRRSFTQKAPGGESYADVEARVRNFWQDVSSRGYNKIIVVAHNVAFCCLLKVIRNLSEEETLKMGIKSCSPIVVEE